jgi:hypothetical protein
MMSLGAMIGTEVAAGVLVAPVIFFPEGILGENVLSHYQSGILMTQVFLRFNMMLLFVTLFGLVCEIYMAKKGHGDTWAGSATAVVIGTMMLFIFYYTPLIVEAQANGPEATQTVLFSAHHKGSEWAMKIMLMAQTALMGRRLWLRG